MDSKGPLDSDMRILVILWYFITVFNINRYFFSVIMVNPHEIDSKQC